MTRITRKRAVKRNNDFTNAASGRPEDGIGGHMSNTGRAPLGDWHGKAVYNAVKGERDIHAKIIVSACFTSGQVHFNENWGYLYHGTCSSNWISRKVVILRNSTILKNMKSVSVGQSRVITN